MPHEITVAELLEALTQLGPGDILIPNRVVNLTIALDGQMIGFVDLLLGAPMGERVQMFSAEDGGDEGRKVSPSVTAIVQGVTAGQRYYILVDCWDNDQEIVIPSGWRLDREYRWFDCNRYKALISHEQTSSAAYESVTISLKNDTLAATDVVTEEQIENLFFGITP